MLAFTMDATQYLAKINSLTQILHDTLDSLHGFATEMHTTLTDRIVGLEGDTLRITVRLREIEQDARAQSAEYEETIYQLRTTALRRSQRIAELEQMANRRKKANLRCGACGGQGHTARSLDCPEY